jgi:GT2 family glycosyltransferase
VLAVIVAHDPGDWFDETLESLAAQDYPRLAVLVVDAWGDPALGGRVEAVLPAAAVLDAADTEGFSAAANAVLDTDADPAFLLVCHDDVALGTETVRQLVAESLRSNAGIAGPKLVDWDHPGRLQHVAYSVDRFAVAVDVVDPGELDQEQFDAVGDVFALPSACLLIRTGLFRTLGGFDEEIGHRGEEVDFCWRAQLLGARIMVVPNARVRHRDDL